MSALAASARPGPYLPRSARGGASSRGRRSCGRSLLAGRMCCLGARLPVPSALARAQLRGGVAGDMPSAACVSLGWGQTSLHLALPLPLSLQLLGRAISEDLLAAGRMSSGWGQTLLFLPQLPLLLHLLIPRTT